MGNRPPPSHPWRILGSTRPISSQTPPPPAQPRPRAQPQPQPPAPRPVIRLPLGRVLRPATTKTDTGTAAPPCSPAGTPNHQKTEPSSSSTLHPPAHLKFAPHPVERKTIFKPSDSTVKPSIVEPSDRTVKPSIVVHGGYDKDIETEYHKQESNYDGVKIITIARSNNGAIMKHTSPATTEGSTPSPPMNSFINYNLQAINNSVLVNTSCTGHDPVHVFFSDGGGHRLHLKDSRDGYK